MECECDRAAAGDVAGEKVNAPAAAAEAEPRGVATAWEWVWGWMVARESARVRGVCARDELPDTEGCGDPGACVYECPRRGDEGAKGEAEATLCPARREIDWECCRRSACTDFQGPAWEDRWNDVEVVMLVSVVVLGGGEARA
jgi:hypothetical protein